jgi:hypothetical protein
MDAGYWIGGRPTGRKNGCKKTCYFDIGSRFHHVQNVLAKTPLPEDVTVVFDMDALNFS